MANNFYPCTAISGATGSVKALHKNDLADGDTAMAILTTGYVHFYRADATSGATEDLPAVVEPGGTGDLRFIEMFCTKLAIQDISETYYTSIVSGDTLTANRALTIILGDAARQITLSGNPTLADWFDQSVKTTASPTFDKMYFNTNPTVGDTAEGKLYYDAAQHTLSLNLSDDVNLQIGQETLIRVHNDTGSTISNGSAVYLTGASGVHPTVALAKADYEDTYYAVGVATQDIDDGDEGFVTRTGKIHDLDTSSFAVGESLYVSATTAGALTNVKPSTLAMRIGRVVASDATAGIIYVNLAPIQSTSAQISAGAAVSFFFDGTEIIGTGNDNDIELETLSKTPSQAAETVETVVVNNNTVLNEAYLYNTALDRTSISAGIWKFYNWCGVDSAVGVTELLLNVMRVRTPSGTVTITGTGTSRTATASTGAPFALQVSSVNDDGITNPSGSTIDTTSYIQTPNGVYAISARTSDTVVTITVPTTYTNESAVAYSVHKRLFQTSTGELNNNYGSAPSYTGLQLYTVSSSQSAFTVVATDKLSVFRFGKTTRTSNVTIAAAYGGSTRYSYFETPLETLHGNLPGLQGGTGTVPDDEYYHLTSAQHTIATQAATAAINGYATSTQITKLDGIEALADVTDATNVNTAGAVMESDYNAHSILAATDDNTPAVLTVGEQTVVGRLTGGNISAVTIGIADNNIVQMDSASAATGEYAKFTANGLESKSIAEVQSDLSIAPANATAANSFLVSGSDPFAYAEKSLVNTAALLKDQFPQAITDNHVITVDDAGAADDEYARFTANGLESRTASEVYTNLLAQTLLENDAIKLDAALSEDGKYNGITRTGVAGATLAFGDSVYYAVADGRWELTDADQATTSRGLIGICVLAAANDGDATNILLIGMVRAAAFPSFTAGAPVYLSATDGDLTATAPSGTGDIIRCVGQAWTADELWFCPSPDFFEYTA